MKSYDKNIFIHPSFETTYQRYPLIYIDAGASGGIPERWKQAEKYLQVIGFEPDERAYKELLNTINPKQRWINAALDDSDDTVKFYLTKKQQLSSFFLPDKTFLEQFYDAPRYEVKNLIELRTKRLTKLLIEEESIFDADFFKIDVQGRGLNVLKGAKDLLKDNFFGMEIEVEFVPIYKNQSLFPEIHTMLLNEGYQLFDLKRYYWKRVIGKDTINAKGQIIFADALYFKTYKALVGAISKKDREYKKAKILKAITICLLYNYYDYAIYLADKAISDKLLTDLENEIIITKIKKRRIQMNFKGHGTLARLFYKAYKYFNSSGFYFSDEELGG